MYKISELEMCNQVRGFRHGVRKFIVKIQMTFPSSADISLCLHSYLFPSQTELKVIEHFVRRFTDRYFKT
jgi:hypothetical protein